MDSEFDDTDPKIDGNPFVFVGFMALCVVVCWIAATWK